MIDSIYKICTGVPLTSLDIHTFLLLASLQFRLFHARLSPTANDLASAGFTKVILLDLMVKLTTIQVVSGKCESTCGRQPWWCREPA